VARFIDDSVHADNTRMHSFISFD